MPQLFYYLPQQFLFGVTTQVLVITIEIVRPTKKIVVLTNKIAEAYFTNRSSWFYRHFFSVEDMRPLRSFRKLSYSWPSNIVYSA